MPCHISGIASGLFTVEPLGMNNASIICPVLCLSRSAARNIHQFDFHPASSHYLVFLPSDSSSAQFLAFTVSDD